MPPAGLPAGWCLWQAMVDAEEAASFQEGYINDSDPSVLRFLIASREEVSSKQVRLCPKHQRHLT